MLVKAWIEADAGTAVCRLEGELDSFGAAAFREAMAALSAFRSVVIDLGAVTFVDSAGLGVMVAGVRRMRSLRGEVVLAAPRPAVERVLRMVGIDGVVPVVGAVEDAVRLVSRPAAS